MDIVSESKAHIETNTTGAWQFTIGKSLSVGTKAVYFRINMGRIFEQDRQVAAYYRYFGILNKYFIKLNIDIYFHL